MGESSSSQGFTFSLSSPALALSSPPFSISNSSSTDGAHSFVFNPPASSVESSTLQKLSSNINSLLSAEFDNSFSDVLIYISNCVIPLHRCILAARCPFFKSLFSKDTTYLTSLAPEEQTDDKPTKLKIDLGWLLSTLPSTGKASYDAFMTIISFLYSGYQTIIDVKCIDDHCPHEACRPVVEFAVEMLGLSSVLDIIDLKIFWQYHLQELVEKAQVDEVLPVLVEVLYRWRRVKKIAMKLGGPRLQLIIRYSTMCRGLETAPVGCLTSSKEGQPESSGAWWMMLLGSELVESEVLKLFGFLLVNNLTITCARQVFLQTYRHFDQVVQIICFAADISAVQFYIFLTFYHDTLDFYVILLQYHLQELVEKAQVDEVLPVLVAAKVHGAESLLSRSQHLVAVSNMGTVDIEKQLPMPLSDEVLALRCKMGLLQPETLKPPTYEKECQRIRKALDSDDVELVQLLLKEGQVTLDGAYALHYAVAYCDPRTVKDILELGLADVNARNNRGFTVLHVASMRRDPSILVSLLYKGANLVETTPDGRTSLQLCSRLMRRLNNDSNTEAADLQKECLCVEILHQAGTKNLFEDAAFPPIADEKELLGRLFFLENRVALGRLLFPQEASLVLGITHLESTTSEFVGFRVPDISKKQKREASMDLNQLPSTHNDIPTFSSTPMINEALIKRVEALQRTVTLGRRMFPRCISVLNSFTDDDPTELMSLKLGNSDELKSQKRRYSELKNMLAEAFQKDVAAMERHKPENS